MQKRVLAAVAISVFVAAIVLSCLITERSVPRWAETAMIVFWVTIAFAGPVGILVGHIAELMRRNRRNREWELEHSPGERLRCMECRYCRVKAHHPFSTPSYRNAMVSRYPAYCRRFRRPLNGNPNTRCNAEESRQAMYERKSDASERR